jgi:fumarate reductase iron-sulfur subunit
MAMREPELLEVDVWRGGSDGSGRFQTYAVPRQEAQTVLDVVTWIQRKLDPTLAYRFACRVGMCGSCAMTVNGRARWTCRTHVAKVASGKRLQIAPLANLTIVRDLVVDMREFFDKWAKAGGQFTPTASRRDDFARVAPESPAAREVDAAIEASAAAFRYASCDVSWNPHPSGGARPGPTLQTMRDGGRVAAGRGRRRRHCHARYGGRGAPSAVRSSPRRPPRALA